MEYPQDWVITTLGKIVRRDKAKPKDIIPEVAWGGDDTNPLIPNSFREKDDAINARDFIADRDPAAFIPEEEPKRKPGPRPHKKPIEQDEFRDLMRAELMERQDKFWAAWEKLRPDDKCAIYAKLLLFAYSKAPLEKVVDPAEAIKRKNEAKRQAAAERISQGLPDITDTNFEE